jgi:hypothetical protein
MSEPSGNPRQQSSEMDRLGCEERKRKHFDTDMTGCVAIGDPPDSSSFRFV